MVAAKMLVQRRLCLTSMFRDSISDMTIQDVNAAQIARNKWGKNPVGRRPMIAKRTDSRTEQPHLGVWED